jgi:hypothetical protein
MFFLGEEAREETNRLERRAKASNILLQRLIDAGGTIVDSGKYGTKP